MAFVLAFKLLFNLFAHAQFVKTYPFIVLKTEKPSLILTEFQLLLFFIHVFGEPGTKTK